MEKSRRFRLPQKLKRGGGGVSPLVDAENKRILAESLASREFTPFLGPECSTIRREESEAWKSIGEQIDWLLANDDLNEREHRTYLRSLADSQVVTTHFGNAVGRRRPNVESRNARPSTSLDAFRVQLVKLACKVHALFGSQMTKHPSVVTDAADYRVQTEETADELEETIEQLVKTCLEARLLVQANQDDRLDANGVYKGLIELTKEIIDGSLPVDVASRLAETEAHRQYLAEVLNNLGVYSAIVQPTHRSHRLVAADLHLHHLEWISDLLWYTLRYDASAYPTGDELVFQVALNVGYADRRPELASIAQVVESEWRTRSIRNWFGAGRRARANLAPRGSSHDGDEQAGGRMGELARFYSVLAGVLADRVEWEQDELMPHERTGAVVFSTNFDLEMEDALKSCGGVDVFHVAVPVLAIARSSGEDEIDLRWLLATISKGDKVEEPGNWEPFPEGSRKPDQIKGPIVIKLNGSPLHVLPSAESIDFGDDHRSYSRLVHSLTISEFEYLQNVILLSMPAFFLRVATDPNRSLYFLGQPIAEWSTRLWLFRQRYPDWELKTNDRPMFSINQTFPKFRSSVLAALGINRWEGDLTEVTDLMEKMLH